MGTMYLLRGALHNGRAQVIRGDRHVQRQAAGRAGWLII
ncbi:hypothetical protein PA05_2368 [Cutibacterium acnes P05]|nr:hypothetical protein [Cutibacterium acnes P05]